MLVITRQPGQSFVVDGDIEVTILAVRGKNVRVGIRAPQVACICRTELLQSSDRASELTPHEPNPQQPASASGTPGAPRQARTPRQTRVPVALRRIERASRDARNQPSA